MPASLSLARDALPLGLAHGVRVKRDLASGAVLSWRDVDFDTGHPAVAFRREMEREFGAAR